MIETKSFQELLTQDKSADKKQFWDVVRLSKKIDKLKATIASKNEEIKQLQMLSDTSNKYQCDSNVAQEFKARILASQFDFNEKQRLAILKLMRYAYNRGVGVGADMMKKYNEEKI